MVTTIHDILKELSTSATSNRDKGDKFEPLILEFLKADPLYSDRFEHVWLWNDWPGRAGKTDTGINIVAQQRGTGEYCAIQCKFYASTYELQKADIDFFLTASGKELFTSRIIISTTDHWSRQVVDALDAQTIPVMRLSAQDLHESAVDWSQFSLDRPTKLRLKPKKVLYPHQKTALAKTIEGFASADRGKLIMACGSGKTYTSLKIAEHVLGDTGFVLFLAPSILLISLSLREWSTEASSPFTAYAVCSETKVGRDHEDMRVHDLALPAITNAKILAYHISLAAEMKRRTVIFSTYQSIKVIHDAQKCGLPQFDLVVCDEAHLTTGTIAMGEEESEVVRIHDQHYLHAKKRIYMTAVSRIDSDATRVGAQEKDVELCSMNDEAIYGKEFYRLGFDECISKRLLSDHKFLVLAVDEKLVSKRFQQQLTDSNNELTLEDAAKIVGCWNGLSKRDMHAETIATKGTDTVPMRRAVAFAKSIGDCKEIWELLDEMANHYKASLTSDKSMQDCEARHVDGTFNMLGRKEWVDWLREETKGALCRVLSDARYLAEDVDVPALVSVMFLNPRESLVDVVRKRKLLPSLRWYCFDRTLSDDGVTRWQIGIGFSLS
jgi:predicted helicase